MDINKNIGLPYKLNGKDTSGFDCWGFFVYFNEQENGLVFSEQYHLNPETDLKKILAAFSIHKDEGIWEKIDTPKEGCAVALGRINHIHHIGVYIKGGIMHCIKGLGVVYETESTLKRSGYNRVEYYTCLKNRT